MAEPTYEELKAKLAELEKKGTGKRTGALEFRVGEKGGVSVYGLGRFPVMRNIVSKKPTANPKPNSQVVVRLVCIWFSPDCVLWFLIARNSVRVRIWSRRRFGSMAGK